MAGARSDLFKWKRQTKPTHQSRSGIQSWIKNVQRASDEAAREVFGDGYPGVLDQVYADDDALSEAQDLLDSWVKEKTLKSIQPELEFFDEKWASNSPTYSSRSTTKPELYSFENHTDSGFNLYANRDHKDEFEMPGHDYDEDLDEEIAVQEVVRNMLDKQVVKDSVRKDLGFDSKKTPIDPRTKMELRHKQVKEKSENRRRDLEKSRREKVARKEAQHLARQQVIQEEKERQAKAKKEEMLMLKEMARIRKAMEEEQRLKKEQKDREQQLEFEAELLARQQVLQQQQLKEQKQREEKQAAEEMRRLLLIQMEERAAEEAKMNLQLLQKYFSGWYSVLVDQRIKIGKARALSDWKVKLRAWNAWRAYVWHIRSDKEAEAIAVEMKEKHRKEQSAAKLYRKHVLRRCLQSWQVFVRQCQQERELTKQHEEKARKMAALLEAAATGKLWKPNDNDTEIINEDDFWQQNAVQRNGGKKTKNGAESNRLQHDVSEQVDSKTTKKGKGSELLIESVEDEELFGATRQVDEIFSQGAIKNKIINSARSSSSDFQLLPGKPLQNSWLNKQGKDQNNIKTISRNHSENSVRKPRPKQRTLSHVDKVQDLRSKLKEQQTRTRTTLQRSKSTDVLDGHKSDSQGVGLVKLEDGDNEAEAYDMETARSGASSKLLTREPRIRSEKATTKPILLAMEERAKLRAKKKALIDERKRRLEEEKLAKLRHEQEQKEQELLKEKQEILKKKREEKRIEKEREQEKQRRLEELRILNEKAVEHYCKTLLTKYGMSPWKQLVAMAHENMSSAEEHRAQALVITCFYPWLQITRENKARKNQAADMLYRQLLIKRSWRSWRKYGQHMLRLEMVAEDYCASSLLKKYFNEWQDYVTNEQILYWEKERRAEEHNQWRLLKVALTYWKKLIPMAKEERQREKRRTEMRNRVKAWLPDFKAETNSSP